MTTITPAQKLTAIKHLASGKDLEVVATIMGTTKDDILGFARNHGYPDRDKLTWAADIMERKLEENASLPTGDLPSSQGGVVLSPPPADARLQPSTIPPARPDELRILINTGKAHPSKRIQTATDRLIDQVNRLKDLIAEDQEKNAEKRRIEAEREAARAEVKRLERQLAEAKAKLRTPKPTSSAAAAPADGGPTAAEIRTWAAAAGVNCPKTGRIPELVRSAYDDAQMKAAS